MKKYVLYRYEVRSGVGGWMMYLTAGGGWSSDHHEAVIWDCPCLPIAFDDAALYF